MNKKALEDLISEEITKADPIGLISMGAPSDEYDPEVREITEKINLCKSATDLERLIHETFVRMFGGEDTAGKRSKYRILSKRIYKKLNPN